MFGSAASARPSACICSSAVERGEQPGAVVRADRGDVERGEPVGRLARGDARERLGALVEGQQRDDRQVRDARARAAIASSSSSRS